MKTERIGEGRIGKWGRKYREEESGKGMEREWDKKEGYRNEGLKEGEMLRENSKKGDISDSKDKNASLPTLRIEPKKEKE